jgi:chromosome partitioning protein
MTRRIAFINEKGGVGKTTLAVNTAAYFAKAKQRRVLLVDLDTQGHAGKSLGVNVRDGQPNIFHLLTQPEIDFERVVRSTSVPQLTVIPCWKELAQAQEVLGDERLLLKKLQPHFARFDAVFFDAPPSLGPVTLNILLAAEEVVIPVATTYLGLDGCAELNHTVESVKEKYSHEKLRVTVVVPTLHRKSQLSEEVVEKLKHYFPKRVCEPMSLNVAIDEAQSYGKTIWDYAPWSRGASLMQKVAEAVEVNGLKF